MQIWAAAIETYMVTGHTLMMVTPSHLDDCEDHTVQQYSNHLCSQEYKLSVRKK